MSAADGGSIPLDLAGRNALVTAGTDGLGLACARRLAAAGARVAVCGRGEERREKARAALRKAGAADALALPADLTDAASVEALVPAVVERFGGLDLLVVNSGHVAYGGLEDLSDADWQHAFALVLMSAVRVCRGALAPMRAAGRGDVVFISSATLQSAPPHLLLSTAFRLGVAGLAKSLSHAVAGEGIRVNTVAPGYFDTGRVAGRIDALAAAEGLTRAEAALRIAGEAPMGRIGDAEELAETVAFIAGSRVTYLNGATIALDGGKGRTVL